MPGLRHPGAILGQGMRRSALRPHRTPYPSIIPSLTPGRHPWPERAPLSTHAHGTIACPQLVTKVPNQFMSTWHFDLMLSLALALAW